MELVHVIVLSLCSRLEPTTFCVRTWNVKNLVSKRFCERFDTLVVCRIQMCLVRLCHANSTLLITHFRSAQQLNCLSLNSVAEYRSWEKIKPSKAQWRLCVSQSKTERSAHTVCLCVLGGSQNKQRLFPYTTLADWFL